MTVKLYAFTLRHGDRRVRPSHGPEGRRGRHHRDRSRSVLIEHSKGRVLVRHRAAPRLPARPRWTTWRAARGASFRIGFPPGRSKRLIDLGQRYLCNSPDEPRTPSAVEHHHDRCQARLEAIDRDPGDRPHHQLAFPFRSCWWQCADPERNNVGAAPRAWEAGMDPAKPPRGAGSIRAISTSAINRGWSMASTTCLAMAR